MRARSGVFKGGVVAALLISGVSHAVGGVGTPSVRLELRIVPQRGLPVQAGGVSDLPTTQHDTIITPGQVRRFEVQYRVVDLIAGDGIAPNGLRGMNLRIDATGPGLGGGGLQRATLSRFEAELAGATPPVTPDVSGSPVALAGTGLHRPFRDGVPAPAPNNDDAANGTLSSGGGVASIVGILPLASVANDQNVVDGWYGLYSFDLSTVNLASGLITLTATAVADGVTGNRLSYWAVGQPTPRLSPAATSGSATVLSQVPSPAASVLGVVACGWAIRSRRRTARCAP